jgi:hypothetical protein
VTRLRFVLGVGVATALFFALTGLVGAQLDPESDVDDPEAPPAGHNLSGLWLDGSHHVQVSQDGGTVIAQYVEPYDCDFRDGSGGHDYSDLDFSGQLSGDTIQGDISVCAFGKGNNPGIKRADVTLTVNAADTQMTGTWSAPTTQGSITVSRRCDSRTAADYGLPDNGTSAAYHEPRLYQKVPPSTTWQYVRTLGPNENLVPGPNQKLSQHEGVDYRSRNDQGQVASVPYTTPVGGTVEVVEGSTFNTVGVRTADGSLIQFLHSSGISVANGQEVQPGDQIGVTGNTAPYGLPIHLHVQAQDPNGNPVNPDCVLRV